MEFVQAGIIGLNDNITVCDKKGLVELPCQKIQATRGTKRFLFFQKVNSIIRLKFFKIGFQDTTLVVYRQVEFMTTEVCKTLDNMFDDGLLMYWHQRFR